MSLVRITGIPKNAGTDRALATGVVVVCAVGNAPVNTSVTPLPTAVASSVAVLPVSETD